MPSVPPLVVSSFFVGPAPDRLDSKLLLRGLRQEPSLRLGRREAFIGDCTAKKALFLSFSPGDACHLLPFFPVDGVLGRRRGAIPPHGLNGLSKEKICFPFFWNRMNFPEPRDILLEFVSIVILFPLVGGGGVPCFLFSVR